MRKISKDFFKVIDYNFTLDDLTIEEFLEFKNIKKLYHVSKVPYKLDKLIPGIPINRLAEEDDSIKRICLSTSLEKAINAIDLQGFICSSNNLVSYEEAALYTELLNGDHLELLIEDLVLSVYEINIEDLLIDDLITYPELFLDSLVPDSIINDEFWYRSEITKFKHKTVKIDSFLDGFCADDYLKISGYELLKDVDNEDELDNLYTEILNNDTIGEYSCINGQEIIKDIKYKEVEPISESAYQEYLESFGKISSFGSFYFSSLSNKKQY